MKTKIGVLLLCTVSMLTAIYFVRWQIERASAEGSEPVILLHRPIDTLTTINYDTLRARISREYPVAHPGKWGEFVKGVDEDIDTTSPIMALTFDACGTKYGDGYNAALIHYLRAERLPATMFFTGLWIDANRDTFAALARDTLFEIENHGLLHRPCAVCGETEYGIRGTLNVGEAIDEIELNNRKIARITGRRPVFFRSSTAFCDEECVKVAGQLGNTIISYDILSGDAVPGTSTAEISTNILKNARDGAIIIMHMNHPNSNILPALRIAIPELRRRGFQFVHLEHHRLKGR